MFKPKVILPDDSSVLGEYAGSSSLKGKPVIVRDTRVRMVMYMYNNNLKHEEKGFLHNVLLIPLIYMIISLNAAVLQRRKSEDSFLEFPANKNIKS
jgi:hypothetical protein